MMKFDNLVLLGEGSRVYVLDEKDDVVVEGELDYM